MILTTPNPKSPFSQKNRFFDPYKKIKMNKQILIIVFGLVAVSSFGQTKNRLQQQQSPV
jgi:3-oxoacyl-ACP reductase-like protein